MYNEFDNENNVSGSGSNPSGENIQNNPQENVEYNSTVNPTTGADGTGYENTGTGSQYRMKFNNGECAEDTAGYHNHNGQYGSYYNNGAAASGNGYGSQTAGTGSTAGNTGSAGYNGYYNGAGTYGSAGNNSAGTYGSAGPNSNGYYNQNEYSYYQQSSPQQPHRPSKKKKKGGFGRQFAKVVCFGLAFGLIAGGTMWGVNTLGNFATGQKAVTESDTQTPAADEGFTLNVVKTSSKDVQTYEANDVSEIVAQAKPSLVAVTTVVEKKTQDFFGRTYSQEGSGAGSGVIFSEKDGTLYIVTNNHVIQDSKQISITFNDGSTAEAQIKGYDANADVAVLTVDMSQLSEETKSAIKIAVLGDSDELKEGNGAIAIGNALGYGQSTTTGTISAVNREVQLTDGTMTLIQTDAAINPGNSGGALLNTRGEVIGINTVKYSETSVEGMGYAIPINNVMETVNDIISGKIVNKTEENTAVLGILGGTVDSSNAYGIPAGVYVGTVVQNSAAQRAGIQAGYVITAFNGQEITTMEELQELIAQCSPGDSVSITVKIPEQLPDNNISYDQEQTFTTVLGSAAESSTSQNTPQSGQDGIQNW